MPYIHSVVAQLPAHYYSQAELLEELRSHWAPKFHNFARIEEFHRHVLVDGRFLALSLEEYRNASFAQRNDAWIRVGLDLLERATRELLLKADLAPAKVALLASTSVTGLAVPSLEARLMNRMPFATHTKRLPLFGLGCLAGVAGMNRAADYLRAFPEEAAVFLSVELCSLTVQLEDLSVANLISSGLFGDGAAALLLVGDRHPLAASAPLQILDTHSAFFPNTERVMGWDITDSGFKVVLNSQVPELVLKNFAPELGILLRRHSLAASQLNFHIAHPGGPKVLSAMEEVLGLGTGDLRHSWESLKSHGNMSSASVLFVLAAALKQGFASGSYGLMAAMGPAFCAEMSLLKAA